MYDADQTLDSGYWVYDYGGIAPHVDTIRIMAYDFSVEEAGPIAPLAWVESTITGAIEAVGSPDKLVLGIPAYGRNWPAFVSGVCPADAEGRTSLTTLTVDDLIARRNATPIVQRGDRRVVLRVPTRGDRRGDDVHADPSGALRRRAKGCRARMDLARQYQLNGVSLWALGFDDEGVWDAILPTVTDPSATTTVP